MRFSVFVASSLAATASAAPTWPDFQLNELGDPLGALNAVSQYFNLVAAKVSAVKALSGPPRCDLSKAVMPTCESHFRFPSWTNMCQCTRI